MRVYFVCHYCYFLHIYNIIGLIVIEKNNNNRLLNTQMPKLRFCMYKRTQHMDTHTYVRIYIHTYIKEVCVSYVYNVEVMLILYIHNNTYLVTLSLHACMYVRIYMCTYLYVCIRIYSHLVHLISLSFRGQDYQCQTLVQKPVAVKVGSLQVFYVLKCYPYVEWWPQSAVHTCVCLLSTCFWEEVAYA